MNKKFPILLVFNIALLTGLAFMSAKIYDLCDCSGIVRIDYILKDNEFYFLEVNTTPGMTATSFVPQQITALGRTLGEVLGMIIEDKLK